jgi:hypothetical protein
MALYNEILVGRFNRLLQKLTGLKGKTGAPQLAGEIMPVIPFFYGAENRFLEGWDRFAASASIAAVAAQSGAARLRNPAGSNLLVVIEFISFSNIVAADLPILFNSVTNTTDLGTIQNPANLDARGRPNSSTIASIGTNAANMTGARALCTKSVLQNTNVDFVLFEDQEFPILPGESYEIRSSNVNQGVNMSWIFRERFLDDSERA